MMVYVLFVSDGVVHFLCSPGFIGRLDPHEQVFSRLSFPIGYRIALVLYLVRTQDTSTQVPDEEIDKASLSIEALDDPL